MSASVPSSPVPPPPPGQGAQQPAFGASPFEPVESDLMRPYQFSVDEVIRVIPAHLVSTVTPPQSTVTLQLSRNGEDTTQGTITTTLMRIYKSCPHLFAQPVSEALDCPITLNLMSQSDPSGRPESTEPEQSDAGGESPFLVVERKESAEQNDNWNQESSPFQMADEEDSSTRSSLFNPFEASNDEENTFLPAEESASDRMSNPFSPAFEEDTETLSPFSAADPFQSLEESHEDTPPPSPSPAPQPEPKKSAPPTRNTRSADSEPILVFGLPNLLRSVDPEVLGIDPESVPLFGQVRLPFSFIKPQLATGRVKARVSVLEEHADEASQPILRDANQDIEISIPLKDVFNQLPSDAISEQPAEPNSTIETPFSVAAREDETRSSADSTQSAQKPEDLAAGVGPAPQGPKQPPSSPNPAPSNGRGEGHRLEPKIVDQPKSAATASQDRPEKSPFEPQGPSPFHPVEEPPHEEAKPASPVAPAAEIPPAPPQQQMESAPPQPPAPAPQQQQTLPVEQPPQAISTEPVPAAQQPIAAPEASPAQVPQQPAQQAMPAPAAAQPSQPPRQQGVSMTSAGRGGLGFQGPSIDLELRALFGGSDPFTPESALHCASQLHGVVGCVLFIRGGEVCAQSLPQSAERPHLAQQMPGIFDKVSALAADLGFTTTETFTLHTGHGVLSFFGEGELCLGVLHEESEFDPGIREKLVLVARGIARLMQPEG